MGIYGEFTWGYGTLWGGSAVVYGTYPEIAYTLYVDWDNDGVFASSDVEEDYMLSWTCERGRDFFLNSGGSGFEPVNEGKLTLTLDNTTGRYDPFNTDSPLYPNVVPGRAIQLIVQDTSTLTNHTVFTGTIDDIEPFANEQTVQITAVDAIRKLNNIDVTIALNADITVSDAIETILEAAGTTDYDIDSQLDVVSYWWVNQQKAFDAVQELCDASIGTFFVAADGTLKYHKRQRPVDVVIDYDQSELLRDIKVQQPWNVIRNNIDIIVNPLVRQATSVLWTLQDAPSVSSSDTITLWGSFTYNDIGCPAIDVISPVASSDYLMNSDAGGGGSDMTSDFTVTVDIFGESIKFTITNNSSSTGYITLLQVRGDPLTTPDPVRLNKVDAASAAAYGNRVFKLNSKWLQNTNIGIDLSDLVAELLASPRKVPTVRIETRPDIQYTADLFDRIGLVIARLSIDGAFRVGNIKHESMNSTCQSVMTTLTFEPVVDAVVGDYWIFPTLIGQTSIFA